MIKYTKRNIYFQAVTGPHFY